MNKSTSNSRRRLVGRALMLAGWLLVLIAFVSRGRYWGLSLEGHGESYSVGVSVGTAFFTHNSGVAPIAAPGLTGSERKAPDGRWHLWGEHVATAPVAWEWWRWRWEAAVHPAGRSRYAWAPVWPLAVGLMVCGCGLLFPEWLAERRRGKGAG
jgi:hypothetical protein